MPRPATAVLATVLGFLSNVAIAQESCHRSGEKAVALTLSSPLTVIAASAIPCEGR